MRTKLLTVQNGDEAVAALGQPRHARATGTIRRREPNGEREIVQTPFGSMEAFAGQDYVATNEDGASFVIPHDRFERNWEAVPGTELFRSRALFRLLEVPNHVAVECLTVKGETQDPPVIEYPDLLLIGPANEVIPVPRETLFDRTLSWV